MTKKILTYGIDEEHLGQIERLSEAAVLTADSSDSDRTLGSLLDRAGERKPAESDTEYMIFSGWDNEEIGSFVSRLRSEGYPFDGILICETETNREWPLRTLLEETAAEHRFFQERNRLASFLKHCSQFDQSRISHETTEIMMAAFTALNSETAGAEDLKRCGIRLMESLERDGLI